MNIALTTVAGWRWTRGVRTFGDEVDDTLPDLERSGDTEERGGLGQERVPEKEVSFASRSSAIQERRKV